MFETPEYSSINMKNRELDVGIYKKIIDEIAPFKPVIGISGGEPLLYEELFELITYVKSKGLMCSVNSNGVLLENAAKNYIDSNLDLLRISIDGPPDIHDDIRGIPKTFDRLMKGLDLLNDMKKQRSSNIPRVEVYFTITDANVIHMSHLLGIIEEKNVSSIRFIHPQFMSGTTIESGIKFIKDNDPAQEIEYLSGANIDNTLPDPEMLIEEINKIKKRDNKISVWFFPDFNDNQIRDYYLDHDNFVSGFKHRCKAPWYSLNINYDGSVEPCPEFRVGNVKDSSLLSIWNNENMRMLRKTIRDEGIIPQCYGCCNLFQSL